MKDSSEIKRYIEQHFPKFILDVETCNPMSLNLSKAQIFAVFTQLQLKFESTQDTLSVIFQASHANEEEQSITAALQVKQCFSEDEPLNFSVTISSKDYLKLDVLKESEIKSKETAQSVILVVDDDLGTRNIIEKWIIDYNPNIKIITARDGHDAVEKFKTQMYFDLIFMDVNMPNLDGFEATEAIRAFEKNQCLTPVRIIAMTAEKLEMEDIIRRGMNGLCKKYIRRSEILEAVANKILPKKTHEDDSEEIITSLSPK